MYRKTLAVSLFFLVGGRFWGEWRETQVQGMIISRTGETLIVSTSGRKVNVVLTDNTKTKDNKGLLGLRKEYMSNTVLIPGPRDRNRQAHSSKSVDWYKAGCLEQQTAAEAL